MMKNNLKNKKIMKKSSKGITLIALVITIIVLLILAGISIAMLSGDNSILNKTGRARDITGQKEIEEKVQIAYMAALTNGNGSIELEDFKNELIKQFDSETINNNTIIQKADGSYTVTINGVITKIGGSTHTETVNGIELTVLIPSGFTKSTVTGETSVATGLVIRDSIGNEYVWIPVFEYDSTKCTWGADYTAVRSVTEGSSEYYTAIETALKNYTATYKSSSCSDVWFGNDSYGKYGYYDGTKFVYYTNGNMTEAQYIDLYHGMLKSVYENGGFYIGRYEMGIAVVDNANDASTNTRTKLTEYTPSTATSTSTDNTASTSAVSISGMTAPLSKQNAVAYTRITQSQAEMLAEMLNYNGLTSSLMFGVQWDAVCVYLEHFGKIDNGATASGGTSFTSSYLKSNDYSKLWGNYKNATFVMNRGFFSTTYSNTTAVTWNQYTGTAKDTSTAWLCTTGASDQNRACNIYDFAGNLSEWTLERCSSANDPCVIRGYNFIDSDSASRRNNTHTRYSPYYYSARSSLYIGSPES